MITIQLTEEEGKILFKSVSNLIDDPDLEEKDEDEIKMWTILYWSLQKYYYDVRSDSGMDNYLEMAYEDRFIADTDTD